MELDQLNPSQRRAALHVDGPLLVLAGAGSGKTRVITHRVAHLLDLGVPAERIVALSFTNKAAGEMRERLSRMVGRATAGDLALATFHSLGARMLRDDPKGFGLAASRFSILDQGDVFGIVRGLLREHGHHGYESRRFDIPAITQRISLWKNAFCDPERIEEHIVDEYDVVAASIFGPYEDRLCSLGAVDFDDLVCRVARSLRDDARARKRWQARFDYVMVDEYQDTNDAQLELLRQLVPNPFNLAVVGDDDQAIYGWRGAKVENILRFDEQFPGASVIRLEENYRSRAPILKAANAIIEHNKTRHPKRLKVIRRGGQPVTMVLASDSTQEASWVGKHIRGLVVDERIPGTEVAVLYRSAVQAKGVEEELQAGGVPYRVLGGQSMYDKKEIRDALAYLKSIVMPRDELAVRRALGTPSRGIGATTMQRLSTYAHDNRVTLLEAARRAESVEGIPARATAALTRFATLIRSAQARSRKGDTSQALADVLSAVELREHVRKETGSDEATEYRWSGVKWLLGSVDRFESRVRGKGKPPRWGEYLGSVTLDSTGAEAEEQPKGEVTLATLHSAKGLEWDVVFIIGVEDGQLPHRRVDAPRESDAISGDVEEERRLFYVGITRAREQLFICRSGSKVERGKEIERAPSRFLEELPEKGLRQYVIADEEELTSDAIGDMADDFLAKIRPDAD